MWFRIVRHRSFGKDVITLFKKHKSARKKPPAVLNIFRSLLSLIMISILSLGVYKAYQSFTLGANASNFANLDSIYQVGTSLLSFNPVSLLTKGKSVPRQLTLGVSQSINSPIPSEQPKELPLPTHQPPKPKLTFRFAIIADSHNDNVDLKKALDQAKSSGAEFIIGLGDYSDVGTIDELQKAKVVFDSSGVPYHLIPGDHDLWDSRNRGLSATADFNQVFGTNFQAFTIHQSGFLLIDNSDNYSGIGDEQKSFIQKTLNQFKQAQEKFIFVLSSIPFYHPTSDHVMGSVEPKLKAQAKDYIDLFNTFGVSEILAGDTHLYTEYTEPRYNLKMVTIGAVTATNNLALPRFSLVDVFEDGSYNIQDTEIK